MKTEDVDSGGLKVAKIAQESANLVDERSDVLFLLINSLRLDPSLFAVSSVDLFHVLLQIMGVGRGVRTHSTLVVLDLVMFGFLVSQESVFISNSVLAMIAPIP